MKTSVPGEMGAWGDRAQVLKMDIGSSLRPGVYKQNLKAQGAWGMGGRDGRAGGGE